MVVALLSGELEEGGGGFRITIIMVRGGGVGMVVARRWESFALCTYVCLVVWMDLEGEELLRERRCRSGIIE